jgi:hypothetical protein
MKLIYKVLFSLNLLIFLSNIESMQPISSSPDIINQSSNADKNKS